MEAQNLINIVGGTVLSVLGWFARQLWDAVQDLKRDVLEAEFSVSGNGQLQMPAQLKDRSVKVGHSTYRLGIGGLHSSESCVSHYAGDGRQLIDVDMTSYYPFIILGQRLYPPQCGPKFLDVYKSIVDRRIAAKKAKDTVTADSLKITINGSFGKLGTSYSKLYAPDLFKQVTITGQLALLMLIEALELRGVRQDSATRGSDCGLARDGELHEVHPTRLQLALRVDLHVLRPAAVRDAGGGGDRAVAGERDRLWPDSDLAARLKDGLDLLADLTLLRLQGAQLLRQIEPKPGCAGGDDLAVITARHVRVLAECLAELGEVVLDRDHAGLTSHSQSTHSPDTRTTLIRCFRLSPSSKYSPTTGSSDAAHRMTVACFVLNEGTGAPLWRSSGRKSTNPAMGSSRKMRPPGNAADRATNPRLSARWAGVCMGYFFFLPSGAGA